jgi:hypothetical protein
MADRREVNMSDNKDTTKGQPTATDVERRTQNEEEQQSFRLLDNRLSFKLIR